MDLDKTDAAILGVLEKNARLSLRKVAVKVGVSVATVMHRLLRLESEGVVRGYSVVVDSQKLGYDLQAITSLIVSKGKLFEVEKKIATHPNVMAVYDVTGSFDVIVISRFKNRKSLDAFIKKIQTYDFVEKTETMLVLNTIKEGPLAV
ncbi:MAG: Lrp/AsnC family transcriptional regulator [archaeon]|nr:Lrp/AsnC family transcriptional regulator [archaeon]